MAVAYIGIGSNLDDPALQVRQAIESLNDLPKTRLLKASSLYGSKPQGPQDQPDFINAVASIETDLSPLDLLLALQQQEQQQGKIKKRHWGERVIDLDILLYDDVVLDQADLILPHPQIDQRDFVLLPLQEVMADREIPGKGSLSDLIAALPITYVYPLNQTH
ncbi:MAG: 2-amino-4-hydroxy-6-hydroxymethyldihydropteridine diphosphokinase [Hydrogenovibrio sp.]|nr:2-amino-4-hydroxy-6-hydroxymethyldihydropteridine diphosphokinase [Hydrogenovibrio sp.]